MPPFKDAALAHELKRWMRPDAHNFIRPDWRRFVKAGSEAAALFERYESKYREDQLRDWHGRFADEGRGNGGASGREQGPHISDKPIKLAADITGFTKHGIDRAINRGVSPAAIHDAVVNPLRIIAQEEGKMRYEGTGAVVVLNPAGGVVTVWGK